LNKKFDYVKKIIRPDNVLSDEVLNELRKLTLEEREMLSFETKTRVVYLGNEVEMVKKIEEEAVLYSIPYGYKIIELNGLNIGCGDRLIHSSLIQYDGNRGDKENSKHNGFIENCILGSIDKLPFSDESLDFIVALHVLEHSATPANTILEWLRVLKPGGGIGVVVPNWKYNWDASYDLYPYGHRWNTSPISVMALIKELQNHVISSKLAFDIERFDTYSIKLSFDFVLRKYGTFKKTEINPGPTGREIAQMVGGDFFIDINGCIKIVS
jgi:SAM-dependent methyltransferase